ncbi:hypothetical protein LI90_871 [Carbonactinospora thermoautotrophica]|uniref:Outer membrane channel protein CpnT-like N-terminal domain-containing protein n=1 Tax=Carbonactinospora thermoautotrophica TaxID=1469144 RepID=A0A132MMZ8_9ACTN|nr:hypothetical protein [Carbonactinospora thermoautotrophica]KWW99237.1 hypothetical protein LI90_871 [Carbonactinospora thermoautotrophica]
MAIQLPEELQYLLVVVVGERWPEADEDKLREMAQVWYRLADRFEDALRAGDSPAQAILAENFGESITAFGKCWERFSVGGEGGSQGYLRDAAEMCRNFGEALEQFAGDVEATKDYILIQLGILAAEVALGVAGSVFTFGVSGAAAAAATAATRVVIQQALKQLLRQALKHAVKMAVRGAIEGVLDNALLQGLKQIHGGSPVNVQELLLSGAQGAAGGALGAGFGAGANRFGRHLPGGDGFVKEAAQEFAAEVATNAAVSYGTAALTGQDVGISDILGGAGHGMATSGAHHLGDKRGGGDKLAGMSLPGGGSGSPTGLLDGLTETTGSGGGGTGISAALTTQTTSGPASGGVLDLDGGSRPAGAGAGGPATLDGSPPTRAGDGASVLADGGSGGAATPPRDGSGPAFSDSGPTHGVAGDAPVRAETATSPADAAGGRTETATADGGGSPVDSARDAGRAEPTGRAEAPRTDAPGNPTDSGTPTAGGRTDHGAAPGRPDAPITAHTAAVESPPREAGLGAPAQGAPSSHDGPARPAVDTGAPHAPVGDTRGRTAQPSAPLPVTVARQRPTGRERTATPSTAPRVRPNRAAPTPPQARPRVTAGTSAARPRATAGRPRGERPRPPARPVPVTARSRRSSRSTRAPRRTAARHRAPTRPRTAPAPGRTHCWRAVSRAASTPGRHARTRPRRPATSPASAAPPTAARRRDPRLGAVPRPRARTAPPIRWQGGRTGTQARRPFARTRTSTPWAVRSRVTAPACQDRRRGRTRRTRAVGRANPPVPTARRGHAASGTDCGTGSSGSSSALTFRCCPTPSPGTRRPSRRRPSGGKPRARNRTRSSARTGHAWSGATTRRHRCSTAQAPPSGPGKRRLTPST